MNYTLDDIKGTYAEVGTPEAITLQKIAGTHAFPIRKYDNFIGLVAKVPTPVIEFGSEQYFADLQMQPFKLKHETPSPWRPAINESFEIMVEVEIFDTGRVVHYEDNYAMVKFNGGECRVFDTRDWLIRKSRTEMARELYNARYSTCLPGSAPNFDALHWLAVLDRAEQLLTQ